MQELVFKGHDDQVLTNSLLVAEKFGKRHSDVIRSIENLLHTEDESLNAKMRLAFVLDSYQDSTGTTECTQGMNVIQNKMFQTFFLKQDIRRYNTSN